MKKRKMVMRTDQEKMAILKDAEKTSVAAATKRHGLSTNQIYSWRSTMGQATKPTTKKTTKYKAIPVATTMPTGKLTVLIGDAHTIAEALRGLQ